MWVYLIVVHFSLFIVLLLLLLHTVVIFWFDFFFNLHPYCLIMCILYDVKEGGSLFSAN